MYCPFVPTRVGTDRSKKHKHGTKTVTFDIKPLTDSPADMMAWALDVDIVPSNLVSDIGVNDCILMS